VAGLAPGVIASRLTLVIDSFKFVICLILIMIRNWIQGVGVVVGRTDATRVEPFYDERESRRMAI
jgi:hypothetical protein